MKDITGYGTTEEEFEALPIAVRRKVFTPFTSSIASALSSRSTPSPERKVSR
jgi:hypothetical protein